MSMFARGSIDHADSPDATSPSAAPEEQALAERDRDRRLVRDFAPGAVLPERRVGAAAD